MSIFYTMKKKMNSLFFASVFFPMIFMGMIVTFFVSSFLISSTFFNSSVSALPSSPTQVPTLSLSLSTSSSDFRFNSADLASNAFKTNSVSARVITDNITGYTLSFSDSDEDTSLSGSLTNPFMISSITSNTNATNFMSNTWGYSLNNTLFQPIPKKSDPKIIKTRNTATLSSGDDTGVTIGVKVSSDIDSDIYRDTLEFSVVTNPAPKYATFLRGKEFTTSMNDLLTSQTRAFKHSLTPPANFATATVVSDPDSENLIFAWNDTTDQTIYWWSQADIVYTNENASRMFWSISSHRDRSIDVDLRGINTSKTEDMSQMFLSESSNYSVSNINFSEFDTSSVTDMSMMFGNCKDLLSLDLSKFDTRKVKRMNEMFFGASKIGVLDLSSFNTSEVEYMQNMFNGMSELMMLNISTFNTSNVLDMSGMFRGVAKMNTLDLAHFRTEKVKNMAQMFEEMAELTYLNVASFDTSQVTEMAGMFRRIKKMTSLNISNFNTSEVTNMSQMFEEMTKLIQLDIANFNTVKVTGMTGMFKDMTHLTKIIASNNFNTTNVSVSQLMFYNNPQLVGGNGTSYNGSNPNDKTYARIDRVGTPGYFSES